MKDLKCPKCGSESIMAIHVNPFGGTGLCRDCHHKADIQVFIDCYLDNYEYIEEYDPCYDENGYY